jgi:hypothetical protein
MTLPAIGTEERAVYELVEAGRVDATRSGLYRSALRRLEAHGLVLRRADGGWGLREASPLETDAPPPPRHSTMRPASPVAAVTPSAPPPPREPPMVTLVVRVPQAMLDAIDASGETRSDGVRTLIARGLSAGSGARRRAS